MIDKSNEEISDLIRDWLVRNAGNIVIVLVLAAVMSLGYQWWQGHQAEKRSMVSHQLDLLQESALSFVNGKQSDEKTAREQARAIQATIAKESDNAVLVDLSALLLAGMEQGQEAVALLERAAKSSDVMVAGLARWQLAIHHLMQGDYAAARAQVENMRGGVMDAQLPVLQAYIARAQGDYQAALHAYSSLNDAEQNGLVEMLVNDLEARAALVP